VAFLQNIRTRIGQYFLAKESAGASRARTIMNMDAAKSVGIIYSADNIEQVELVKEYIEFLRKKGKKVKSLGYFAQKELPGNVTTSIDQQCFTMKDINWYYKPLTNIIGSFVKEEYDLLLDLNITDKLPLIFVASQSKGKCKVGKYSKKNESLYDVMIETGHENTLKYFLRNIDTYMDMLNRKSGAEAQKA
jgi:uncharacterized protein DUF6913